MVIDWAWMSMSYWDCKPECLDVLEDSSRWCICNTNLPSLHRLLLHFSYIYTDCDKCFNSRYEYRYRKHIYEYADEDKNKLKLENEDHEEIIIQIKNIIKKNPKIVYMKIMDITLLELINILDNILELETIYPFLKHREYCEIRCNQDSLHEIKKYGEFEYLKYELVKKVAFRFIKNSNHIGTDASLLQLPLHIWDEIFAFI